MHVQIWKRSHLSHYGLQMSQIRGKQGILLIPMNTLNLLKSWAIMVDFVTWNLLNTSYILLLHLRNLRLSRFQGLPSPSAKTARSLVEGQLVPILPRGVELHIL